jgi:hypothetical protein
MPTKKAETTVPSNIAEGEAKPKRVRKPAAPKQAIESEGAPKPTPKAPRRKVAAAKSKALVAIVQAAQPLEAPVQGSPSTEDIAVRAYFIGEHRRALFLHGDSESDWLEAERQLKAEALGIAASLRRK